MVDHCKEALNVGRVVLSVGLCLGATLSGDPILTLYQLLKITLEPFLYCIACFLRMMAITTFNL